MKFCLADEKAKRAMATLVDCSNLKNSVRYRAYNGEQPFGVEIVSYLSETESTSGKDSHTPDEIIKHRDFIIAKLRGTSAQPFLYRRLLDYEESMIDLSAPRADFQLIPMSQSKYSSLGIRGIAI